MTVMTPALEDDSNPVQPVYFQMSCKIEDAAKRIKTLRQLALDLHFDSVSSVFMFKNDDCSTHDYDPLKEIKIRSRACLKIGNCYLSVQPEKMIGFVAQMPNKEIFCIGFCVYPAQVKIDGHLISTGLEGKAYWANFAQTIIFDHSRQENVDECVRSHRAVCQILKQAEKDDILDVVIDPTLFWNLNDLLMLRATIRSSARCHALLADSAVH
jgi:hypothetical protein